MADIDEDRIVEEAEHLLAERGVMTVDELIAALRGRGVDPGSDEEFLDLLYDEGSANLVPVADRGWIHLSTVLRDRIFTHRLTESEVEHDVLTVGPDLDPILIMEDELLRLSDGQFLHLDFPDITSPAGERAVPDEALDEAGSLVLPIGTLSRVDARAEDVLGLRVGAEGITVHRVDQTELSTAPVFERLREAADRPNPPHLLSDIVLGICVDLPDSFTEPQPPLTDLIAEAGLAHRSDWLAPGGFDFDQHFLDVQVDRLVDQYELSLEEALAVHVLLRIRDRLAEAVLALERGDRGPLQRVRSLPEMIAEDLGGRPVASSLPYLVEPWVARAFLSEALGYGDERAAVLGLTAEALEEHSPRSLRPALRWLRAKAYERLGEITKAEECLLAAEKLDPNWSPILLDLARYASDRGDAARGLALLRRADSEDKDPLLEQVLTAFLPSPGPVVGRNDPCWCGSGRKFKQCHLHRPVAPPLEERAVWLYQKAGRFLQDGPWLPLVYDLHGIRTADIEDDDDKAATGLDDDSFVGDVALFEGGAFSEFVEHRGELLPPDELLLAQQWLLVERSVFEVTAVDRGEGFTATDLRTGDEHRVRDRAASRQLKPAMMICARIVPAGETMQVFGGIEPVSLGERDLLIELLDSEPDPEDLVAFCSRRFAPPRLTNTEGDSIVLCELALSVSDPDALGTGLDQLYRRLDSEVQEWLHERTIDETDRILASLRLEGAELRISTNSERRLDDVLTVVRQLDPGATVVSDERQALPDARAVAQLARQRLPDAIPSGRPEDQSPEVQEALAAYLRDYEQKWLDLEIPALQGLTPRQAAEDPTRREDLARLLASFGDDRDSPSAMSPNRLRAALGLSSAG